MTYSPEKFASLYASGLGQRIWAFLTRAENVARLETASELGKPAVEVDLSSGRVTVSSESPLDDAAVQAAVEEAGYEVIS